MLGVIRMGGALRSLAWIGIAPGSGMGTAVAAGSACGGRNAASGGRRGPGNPNPGVGIPRPYCGPKGAGGGIAAGVAGSVGADVAGKPVWGTSPAGTGV